MRGLAFAPATGVPARTPFLRFRPAVFAQLQYEFQCFSLRTALPGEYHVN